MRKTVALTSLLLLFSLTAPPSLRAQRAKASAGVRLVETGDFHGAEVSARTGETWLDLYVQVSWNYNVIQRKLLLSSGAGPRRLVREAAEFYLSGC